MSLFELNLFEKLLDGDVAIRGHVSVSSLKDSVAQDVEAILNTRCGLTEGALQAYPKSQRSLLSFGLKDFVSLSLSKEDDRKQICDDIRKALLLHEPRLRDPVVTVNSGDCATQQLNFSIQAVLAVPNANEVVNFDAVLQPNTFHYQVSRGR